MSDPVERLAIESLRQAADEITRLRAEIAAKDARIAELRKLLRSACDALCCGDTEDTSEASLVEASHWCPHCDDSVDRNALVRTAILEALL